MNEFDKDGREHGYWEIYWAETGKLWQSGTYSHGKKVGHWEYFYSSGGRMYTKIIFDNGGIYWEDYWGDNVLAYRRFII